VGKDPKANPDPYKTSAKFNQRMQKTAGDGLYMVTRAMAEFANHARSCHLFGGGGGNRTVPGTSWFGRFNSDCAERRRSEDLAQTQ
jgi:hypothetical protein